MDMPNFIQAASYSGISKSSLDKLRVYGGGPPYMKVTRVVYDRSDLDIWIVGKKLATHHGRTTHIACCRGGI
jgi:hypothetical protein